MSLSLYLYCMAYMGFVSLFIETLFNPEAIILPTPPERTLKRAETHCQPLNVALCFTYLYHLYRVFYIAFFRKVNPCYIDLPLFHQVILRFTCSSDLIKFRKINPSFLVHCEKIILQFIRGILHSHLQDILCRSLLSNSKKFFI